METLELELPLRGGVPQFRNLTRPTDSTLLARATSPVRMQVKPSRDGRMVRLEVAVARGTDFDSLVVRGRPTWIATEASRRAWAGGGTSTGTAQGTGAGLSSGPAAGATAMGVPSSSAAGASSSPRPANGAVVPQGSGAQGSEPTASRAVPSAGCADVQTLSPVSTGREGRLGSAGAPPLVVMGCSNPRGVTGLQIAWAAAPLPPAAAAAGCSADAGCVDLILGHADSTSQWRLMIAPRRVGAAWFWRRTATDAWQRRPAPAQLSSLLSRSVITAPDRPSWGLEIATADGWRFVRLQARGAQPRTAASSTAPAGDAAAVWALDQVRPRASSLGPTTGAPREDAAAAPLARRHDGDGGGDGTFVRTGGADDPLPVIPPMGTDEPPLKAWLAVSAASPLPLTAERQGRVAWGGHVIVTQPAWSLTAAVLPPAVVPPLLPLLAEPNRRVPRLVPEGRADLLQWRTSPGSYLWMDSWRVDRSLASVTLRGTPGASAARGLWRSSTGLRASVFAGQQGLSAWAVDLPLGAFDLRAGALRDATTPTAIGTLYPWAGAATLQGAGGAPWTPDSTLGEHARDTVVAALRPVPARARWRGAVTYATRAGRWTAGRSTGVGELDVPFGRTYALQLLHERIPQGLNAAGMVRAPWEGITRTESVLRHTDAGAPLQWDLRVGHVGLMRGAQVWDQARSPGREVALQPSVTLLQGPHQVRLTTGLQWFTWAGLDPRPHPMTRLSLRLEPTTRQEIVVVGSADAFPVFLRGGAPGRQVSGQVWGRQMLVAPTSSRQVQWQVEGGLAGGISRQCGAAPVGAVVLGPDGLTSIGGTPSHQVGGGAGGGGGGTGGGAGGGTSAPGPSWIPGGCVAVQQVWGWGLGTVLQTRHLTLRAQLLDTSEQWQAIGTQGALAVGADPLSAGWRVEADARTPWGRWHVAGACWQGAQAGPCGATTGMTIALGSRGGDRR